MSASNDDSSAETLSTMFSRGLNIHTEIESSCEATNSDAFQVKVRKAILLLEDSTRLVSTLDLFSRNETVSEVPTSTLKFFLLPVLLGDLNSKLSEGQERSEVIKVVEAYYIDFLQRVKDYEIAKDLKVPKPRDVDEDEEEAVIAVKSPLDLTLMNQERNAKIERYKTKKSLEGRLQELKAAVDHPTCDEDILREFYLKTIQRFVITTLDELESLKQEKMILSHMAKLRTGKVEPPKPKPSRPLKPIIITRDAAQKQVFGMGYTSLPVMSIEEFYDERARNGWYDKPKPESLMDKAYMDPTDVQDQESENARIQEEKEERDDETELARKRGWDEYTDEHKRGEGNRHNMG